MPLKMMLCVMMLPVVVGCTSKQFVSQCVKPPPPPAWIMQPPPDWQTPLNGIISPQREVDHYAKQLEGTQTLYTSRDRVAHIDGQLMQLLWAIHTRFQRSINAWGTNRSNPFTNVCWVSVLTTFLRRHKFWLHRQFSSAQFQKRRNDGWWFPCAIAVGLFWNINVCWAYPVISRASAVASSIFFMVLFPMLLKFAESYV